MSTAAVLVLSSFQLLLGVALVMLVRWGREHAATLSPLYLDEYERRLRSAEIRRGGTAAAIAGGLIIAATVIAVSVNIAG